MELCNFMNILLGFLFMLWDREQEPAYPSSMQERLSPLLDPQRSYRQLRKAPLP